MAQHDYVIDNGTGSVVRADINSVLQAIASNNSGGSDPSTTYALQYYADTGDTILKLRNAANDGFVNLRKFDGSLPLPDGSSSSPSLFFDDDTNTGIFSAAADTFNIATAGSERVRVDSSGNVGIGTASAAANLHIKSTFPAIRLEDSSDYAQIDANSGTLRLQADAGGATASSRITFHVDGSEFVRIDSSGKVGIGTTSPDQTLHVMKGDASASSTSNAVITLENNTNCILQLLSPNDASQQVRFGDPQDTGAGFILYDHDTNVLSFGANGLERARLDSSGKLGIGTTSPVARLEVIESTTGRSYSISSQTELVVERNGNSIISIIAANNSDSLINFGDTDDENIGSVGYDHSNNSMVFRTNDTVRMTLTSAGTLNIDNNADTSMDSSASGQLQVGGNGYTGAIALDGTAMHIYHNSNARALIFGVNETEAARFTSTGRFLVGLTSASPNGGDGYIQGQVGGSSLGSFLSNAGTSSSRIHIRFTNTNGVVGSISTSGSATSFTTSSDYRLKENAVAISDGIKRLKTLKPYKFNFITDPSKTIDGFFAHEVTAVPEAVTGVKDEVDSDDNPVYQAIDHSKLVPLLVSAVKELITKVEALEAA